MDQSYNTLFMRFLDRKQFQMSTSKESTLVSCYIMLCYSCNVLLCTTDNDTLVAFSLLNMKVILSLVMYVLSTISWVN